RAPRRSRQSRLPGRVRPPEWQASHGAAIRCIPGASPSTAQKSARGTGVEPATSGLGSFLGSCGGNGFSAAETETDRRLSMRGIRMNLMSLNDTRPWDWPEGTGKMLLDLLRADPPPDAA